MKAYIVHDSPLGTDYSGAGMYALITEKEETLYKRWCSNRDFANSDLSSGLNSLLDEKGVTEVWSRGINPKRFPEVTFENSPMEVELK